MTEPARLICQRDKERGDVYISKINGKAPSISGSISGTVYILPGLHSISVRWSSDSKQSLGDVTFEHVYTFESSVYELTGEVQGNEILFRIKRG